MLRSIRREILVSLVTSALFIILLNPLFEFTWSFLKRFYSIYIDSIYLTASLGQRNWLDFIMYSYFNFLLINFIVGTTVIIGIRHSSSIRENAVAEQMKSKTNEETKVFLEQKEKETINKLKRFETKLNIAIKVCYIILPIFIISTLSTVFKAYADLQLNTSFRQRLNIIAPYITEEEEEKLISKWSKMLNRNDYVLINNSIEKIAKDNKIALPPNLLE